MIFYMTIMAIIQANEYNTTFKPEMKKFETRPLVLLKNIGTFIYLFCGVNTFHQVYTTVRYPTNRRVVKMTTISVVFIWIFASVFAGASYYALGQGLKNIGFFPDRPKIPGNSDIPNTILKASKEPPPKFF